MSSRIDISGRRFGLLVAIKPVGSKWSCRCDCGVVKDIDGQTLRRGMSRSCGCAKRALYRASRSTHGMTVSDPKTYASWLGARFRCLSENHTHYREYGGRGIRMCDRWVNSPEVFLQDMGPRPEGGTIERVDVNGDYEPSNCRWASRAEQAKNRRNTKKAVVNGEEITVSDLAEKSGLKPYIIRNRLALGWSLEEAILRPVESRSPSGKRNKASQTAQKNHDAQS